ncbi:hypothetical protein [Paracoccus sp. KR1-242]|uniref:hypothetical protein n=1 Tax=Paracoccus sp. KR1-242 TaxID=3410028 RepID=UPI003C0F6069
MPAYTATESWSAQIAVQEGDIIQNGGSSLVRVCAADPASDDDAIDLTSKKAVKISAAGNVRIRCVSGNARVKIVRGL